MNTSPAGNAGVLFFCKMPPPYTGMTVGTRNFAEMVREATRVRVIDTSAGSISPGRGVLTRLRYYVPFAASFLGRLATLGRAVRRPGVETLYIVGSPSVGGHLRNVLALAVARRHVSRVVVHVHNGNFAEVFEHSIVPDRVTDYFRDNVDLFVFSSTSLSERCCGHLPASKRTVVHNTVDQAVRCSPEEVEAKIRRRTARDELRVLFLSNMLPSKGYADLARAGGILLDGGQVRFGIDFVGDWPNDAERRQLEEMLDARGLTDVVTVHGPVTDRTRVKELLLGADIFVLPTYYPREAQPFSIVEAMNAGTPVVSTRHASIPEYVHHDRNGYLVEKQSASEIAEAIAALEDVKNWTRKARAARTTYEEQFSPDQVKREMLRALQVDGSGTGDRARDLRAATGVERIKTNRGSDGEP